MFSKISEILTQQLENDKIISSDKRQLYKYGFQNGLIMLLNFATSIIISLIFNCFLDILFLLITFIPLRSYAGGHHSGSSEKCYVVSTLISLLWAVLLRFEILSSSCCVIMLIIGTVTCFVLAPVEDKNKPLDEDEYERYKKRSLIILSCEIVLWFVFDFNYHKIKGVIPLAIFTESVMLVLGYLKNKKLDR